MNPLIHALGSAESTLMAELEAIYKDLHRHPELSMQEVRTAKIAADALQRLGYEVTRSRRRCRCAGPGPRLVRSRRDRVYRRLRRKRVSHCATGGTGPTLPASTTTARARNSDCPTNASDGPWNGKIQ